MMRLRVSGLPAASSFELFTTRYTCFHSFQPFFAVQTAMKRSPHPAGRALRSQRKFVALAWSRVTPHPPCVTRYATTYIGSTVQIEAAKQHTSQLGWLRNIKDKHKKRTNSAVIATLQQSHEGLPKSIFLSQSSVESRD